MLQKYGQKTDIEGNDEPQEEEDANEETGDASGGNRKNKVVNDIKPPPPTAPPELLKVATGFVLVHQPPTQAFLQQLARLGIEFHHIVHFTNNPEDIEEAEAAGATQFACTDSEVVFEDEVNKPEVDANEKQREREIDDALILDIEVEPSTRVRPLTDTQGACDLQQQQGTISKCAFAMLKVRPVQPKAANSAANKSAPPKRHPFPFAVLGSAPAKIEATLTDLLKHYRLRQLIDPFYIKPDPPERVVPPPNLEEVSSICFPGSRPQLFHINKELP